ncbi:MAG TPA: PLP-dependent aminotransferase family protein, partial [Polyangia bacterium]
SQRRKARDIKQAVDLQSNSLAQAIVEDYFARVDFDARLKVLQRFYRRRAHQLAEAVARVLPSWQFDFPDGGFSLWVKTDAIVDETRFLARAIDEGVSFDIGSAFTRRRPAGPNFLRLCFSAERPARFLTGVERLARAWRWAVKSAKARAT